MSAFILYTSPTTGDYFRTVLCFVGFMDNFSCLFSASMAEGWGGMSFLIRAIALSFYCTSLIACSFIALSLDILACNSLFLCSKALTLTAYFLTWRMSAKLSGGSVGASEPTADGSNRLLSVMLIELISLLLSSTLLTSLSEI